MHEVLGMACTRRDKTDSDSSGSEVDVSCSRLVEYQKKDGVPSLSIKHLSKRTCCILSNCPAFRGTVPIFSSKFTAVPLFLHFVPLFLLHFCALVCLLT